MTKNRSRRLNLLSTVGRSVVSSLVRAREVGKVAVPEKRGSAKRGKGGREGGGTNEEDGRDGFGGIGHVDGSVEADHFRHVRQGAAVVQVEVTDQDAVQQTVQTAALAIDVTEHKTTANHSQ